jgi:hypothetical protein
MQEALSREESWIVPTKVAPFNKSAARLVAQ